MLMTKRDTKGHKLVNKDKISSKWYERTTTQVNTEVYQSWKHNWIPKKLKVARKGDKVNDIFFDEQTNKHKRRRRNRVDQFDDNMPCYIDEPKTLEIRTENEIEDEGDRKA